MDTVTQELTLTQDKGFTKTLDRGNYNDSMMSISAGAWMNEQVKGVVNPRNRKVCHFEMGKGGGNSLRN